MKQKEVFNFTLMRMGAYVDKYGALIKDDSKYKTRAEKLVIVRNNMQRGKIDYIFIGRERFVVMTDRTRRLKKLEWKALTEPPANPLVNSYVIKLDVMQIGEYIQRLPRPVVQNSVRYALRKDYIDGVDIDGLGLVVLTEKTDSYFYRSKRIK